MSAFKAAWPVVKGDDSPFGTHYGVNYEIALTEYDDLECLIHFEWGTISEDDFSTYRQAHSWARKTIEDQVM